MRYLIIDTHCQGRDYCSIISWGIPRVLPRGKSVRKQLGLEISTQQRWCHDCYRCARAFVFFGAMGTDPYEMGFIESMLAMDKKKNFALFGEWHKKDEYHRYMAVEEELAFLLARENKMNGPLMDFFRSRHQSSGIDVERRIGKLREMIFRLQDRPGRTAVEKKAAKLHWDFLKEMC